MGGFCFSLNVIDGLILVFFRYFSISFIFFFCTICETSPQTPEQHWKFRTTAHKNDTAHLQNYLYYSIIIMKRKFKQWLSSIPTIFTKRIMISHLNTLNINKNTTFGIGNPGPRLCDQSRKNEAVLREVLILKVV